MNLYYKITSPLIFIILEKGLKWTNTSCHFTCTALLHKV